MKRKIKELKGRIKELKKTLKDYAQWLKEGNRREEDVSRERTWLFKRSLEQQMEIEQLEERIRYHDSLYTH